MADVRARRGQERRKEREEDASRTSSAVLGRARSDRTSLPLFFSSFPPSTLLARHSVGRPLLLDAFSFLLFFFSSRSRPPSLLVSLLSPLCAKSRDFFFSIGHVGARAFRFFPFAVNFLCARPRFCPAAPLPLNSSFGDISSCLSAVMAATSNASLFRRN